MNLLENFVNKFSLEQKSISFNFNDDCSRSNSSYCNNLITKPTINTKASFIPTTINNNNTTTNCMSNNTNQVDMCFNLSNGVYVDNFNNNSNDDGRHVHGSSSNIIGASSLSSLSTNSFNDTNLQNASKKGMRNMFSYNQIEILENIFEQTHYPDSTMREKLSAHLGISSSRIQVWFQNRRAKFRKFDSKNKKLNSNGINNHLKFSQHDECLNHNRKFNEPYEKDENKLIQNSDIGSNSYLPTTYINNTSAATPATTTANTQYCSDLIINGSYSNYLKNISTAQYQSSMTPSPQCIQTTVNDDYYNTENNNTQNILNTNYATHGYHSFTTDDFHQKQYDRIQTLYPNSTYQFYAHYQDDNY